VEAAARLLTEEGPDAMTTRGVAQSAGVQAPAIYRLFGDKDGLLEAVAEHVMNEFVSAKAATVDAAAADNVDPLDDLRAGWQSQIDFGVGNPVLFHLLSDPTRVLTSSATHRGRRVLEARIRRVAVAGRLRVSEDRAAGLIQAAGIGAIRLLISMPIDERDPGLADAMYEAVLDHILTDAPLRAPDDELAAIVAVRAIAPSLDALSTAERQVLVEWLDRTLEDQ
jgi:AcrR family transcriptional regulator